MSTSAPTDTALAKTATNAGVRAAVDVSFQQDYRQAGPVKLIGTSLNVLPSASGVGAAILGCTLARPNRLVLVDADLESDTGWTVTDIGLPLGADFGDGSPAAAFRAADGSVTVYLVNPSGPQTHLYCASSSDNWTWREVDLASKYGYTGDSHAFGYAAVAPLDSASAPGVAVGIQIAGASEVVVWSSADDAFYAHTFPEPVSVNTAAFSWTETGAYRKLAVSSADAIYGVVWENGQSTAQTLASASAFQTVAVARGNDITDLFVIEGGALTYWEGTQANTLPSGPGVTLIPNTPSPVVDVAAKLAGDGIVHVLATVHDRPSATFELLHMQSDGAGWTTPAPINASPSQWVYALVDGHGDLSFFTAPGQLIYGHRDSKTGDWTIGPLEDDVLKSDPVEEIMSYSATITLDDGNGGPLAGRSVTLHAAGPVLLNVQGSSVTLDPNNSWSGTTDAAGQVLVTYPTNALAAPSLTFTAKGMSGNIVVDLPGQITADLKAVTAKTLMDATTVHNDPSDYTSLIEKPLLTGDDATRSANAAYLYDACQQVLALAQKAPSATSEALHPRTNPNVARPLADWTGDSPSQLHSPSLPTAHFRLHLTPGQAPRVEMLDAVGAADAKAAALQGAAVFQGLWSDLFDMVSTGLATLTGATFASDAKTGVDVVLDFVIGGVAYVWNGIVRLVEQLLDVLETAFARVSVTLEDVLGWIGWVFDWGDILRMHQVLAYLTGYSAALGAQKIRDAQVGVDAAIEQFRRDIRAWAASDTNEFKSQGTFGNALGSLPVLDDNAPRASDPRNVIARALTTQGMAGTLPDPNLSNDSQSPSESQIDPLARYAARFGASSAGQALLTALTPSDPSQPASSAFDLSMPDLVKLLADGADTMLGLAKAGIDALMGALATGADGAVSGLAAPWTIPLVSDLYSQLTDGAELSTLDVFCLIVAIPTTIAYKATQGASPFADDTSVQAVKAAFPIPGATAPANPASDAIDAAAATAATGTTAPDGVTTTIHLVSAIAAQVAEGLCLGSGGVVDFMTAEANAIGEDPPLAGIDWVVIGLEWLSTATRGVAMMTDPNDGGEWSGGTAAGLRKWVWAASIGICVADLGVALAGKLLPSEQNRRLLRRSWGDGGPIFISCWGLAKAIAYSVAWGFDKQEHPNDVIWVRNLAYVLGTLPDLLKFMIGPTVAKKMKTVDGVSIAAIAIAGTDAVFGSTSIVLASLDESGLFEVNKSASEADSQPA